MKRYQRISFIVVSEEHWTCYAFSTRQNTKNATLYVGKKQTNKWKYQRPIQVMRERPFFSRKLELKFVTNIYISKKNAFDPILANAHRTKRAHSIFYRVNLNQFQHMIEMTTLNRMDFGGYSNIRKNSNEITSHSNEVIHRHLDKCAFRFHLACSYRFRFMLILSGSINIFTSIHSVIRNIRM